VILSVENCQLKDVRPSDLSVCHGSNKKHKIEFCPASLFLSGRPGSVDCHLGFSGKCLSILQLMREVCWYQHCHVLIHIAMNWSNMEWTKWEQRALEAPLIKGLLSICSLVHYASFLMPVS